MAMIVIVLTLSPCTHTHWIPPSFWSSTINTLIKSCATNSLNHLFILIYQPYPGMCLPGNTSPKRRWLSTTHIHKSFPPFLIFLSTPIIFIPNISFLLLFFLIPSFGSVASGLQCVLGLQYQPRPPGLKHAVESFKSCCEEAICNGACTGSSLHSCGCPQASVKHCRI